MSESLSPPANPCLRDRLSQRGYYHLLHALTAVLPPPAEDTPQARLARDEAAIDEVADMHPVNADEASLAAHIVGLRAQAFDALRLLRGYTGGDIRVTLRLQSQYLHMERAQGAQTALLRRLQVGRQKRDSDDKAAGSDAFTRHIAQREMEQVLEGMMHPDGPLPYAVLPLAPPPPAGASGPAWAALPAPVAAAEAAVEPATPPVAAAPEVAMALAGPEAVMALAGPEAARPKLSATAGPAARRAQRHARPPDQDADEPPRDLQGEVDYYAAIYPRRARDIRRCGGLPPDCRFGPPDDALLHAIVTSTSPAMRALDDPAAEL